MLYARRGTPQGPRRAVPDPGLRKRLRLVERPTVDDHLTRDLVVGDADVGTRAWLARVGPICPPRPVPGDGVAGRIVVVEAEVDEGDDLLDSRVIGHVAPTARRRRGGRLLGPGRPVPRPGVVEADPRHAAAEENCVAVGRVVRHGYEVPRRR